jgi:DNA-binding beta-propeller fold protein YncE
MMLMLLWAQCQEGKVFIDEQLTQKWESEKLSVPESVLFDSTGNQLYVSSINGDPFEKDGNGYISIISLDGKTIHHKWVTGLDAPKGMGIIGDKLYVSNIDEFVEIDRKTAKITARFKADSSEFLNDITIDSNGVVYGSDTKKACIYRLKNGQSSIWISGTELNSCNGLCYFNGSIYIGTGNSILRADTAGTLTEVISHKTGSVDGLEPDGSNGFIFSDYTGSVHIMDQKGKIRKLLDTGKAGINAADIEYIPYMKLLLVPTFANNHIVAYELK